MLLICNRFLFFEEEFEVLYWLTRTDSDAGPSPRDPCCGCSGQIHTDYQVLWRKRDSTVTLSRGEHPTLALTGFYFFLGPLH